MLEAQEIAEQTYKLFSQLPRIIRYRLKKRTCENCQLPLKEKIDYIAAQNGEVRWWHRQCEVKLRRDY